ncbi:coiled-coil-helix-coiled-coil-helix domain-containing protein 7 isoform X2 [Chlorocebus sabaeus]|uniref:coiled-coil-helix-coiled-coil-helix domain-containing protein 7 isoform X2 n=1 Tax=Chlorocebus sabaeus TaxID=60711 RepID=UPI0018B02742|nr:coiled-coil-helix-coiled-coil-helix domain-containing protein 7 isoform X2 [Chlorocebus sabaeus]
MPVVTGRLRDPDINPCLSESDASTRCLDENNYEKERCSTYFLKYKNCRKFWVSLAFYHDAEKTERSEAIYAYGSRKR